MLLAKNRYGEFLAVPVYFNEWERNNCFVHFYVKSNMPRTCALSSAISSNYASKIIV